MCNVCWDIYTSNTLRNVLTEHTELLSLLAFLLQLDHWVHYEKPYQVQAVGPDYPSFDLEIDQQRFWGRNYSHMEMTICFKYSLSFICAL